MKSESLRTLPWGETTVASLLFGLIVLSDTMYAVSLSWPFCLGAASLVLLLVLPGFLLWQRQKSLWVFTAFAGALVALHFVALTPVKPFTRFQGDITNGMTKSEVQQLLARNFPATGKFPRPVAGLTNISNFVPTGYEPPLAQKPTQSLQYTLDPGDGRYNAEIVLVYLKNDRVVGSQYLCD